MAYNFYPQYYPQQQPQAQAPVQMQTAFMSVRSEAEARNYPVGFGNSITFKDENAPYVYTKTMGFSQLDTPHFEKYRLVKEEPIQPQTDPSTSSDDKITIEDIDARFEAVWDAINGIKQETVKPTKKKKEIEDDTE